jgi:hypothetical protein
MIYQVVLFLTGGNLMVVVFHHARHLAPLGVVVRPSFSRWLTTPEKKIHRSEWKTILQYLEYLN